MRVEVTEIEQRVEQETTNLLALAVGLIVRTADQADKAGTLRAQIREHCKAIELWFDPLVSSAYSTWKSLTQRRKDTLDRYAVPQRIIDAKLASYHEEQEQVRREAEAAAEQERQRREAEIRAAMIAEANARGDKEAAKGARTAPIVIEDMPAVEAPRKVDGAAFVEQWSAEVLSIKALCEAVARGTVGPELVLPNMPALNQRARALRGEFAVPGCRAVKSTGVRGR